MIPDNFPVMSPVLQISVSYCRDHIVWFVALSTCYLAKKTVNNILAKHLLIVKQASVQQNVEVFTLCMYGIYLFMNSAEPKNAMLLSTDMPGVFQPMSSSQSPPPTPPTLASVLLEHRSLCLQRKKQHFVMSYLCSAQDSDERATAYWFTSLTYSRRSPSTLSSCSLPWDANSFIKTRVILLSFCQTCSSHKERGH